MTPLDGITMEEQTMRRLTLLIDELLPLLRQFCGGEYGIALGGAHAKGVADEQSDVDLYLFADTILANEERSRLCAMFDHEIAAVVSWGDERVFVQAGTDFDVRGQRVECWLRSRDYIDGTIAECARGEVKHDMVTWTVMGYYNYCALSDLQKMVPVDDPFGMLARWKAAVAEYPPLLRQAIVSRFLKAAQFWPKDNIHYASAVERGDLMYVMGIVQQVIQNLVQVVFALNHTYFPGEKKLKRVLSHLPTRPERFEERIEQLIAPGVPLSRSVLREQRAALQQLVDEVALLVSQEALV